MSEELLRRMAKEYAEQSGAELRGELKSIRQDKAQWNTLSLDLRVHNRINTLKRRRYARLTGLAAACLFLVLSIPTILYFNQQSGAPSDSQSDSANTPNDFNYEILPLSFTMPSQFSVSAVEQDIEKTVYYLEDSQLDNIVMTLEHAGDTFVFDWLTPIIINDYTVYINSNQDYNLMAFEKKDVLYILSCKHDINTLVKLSDSIWGVA